MPHIKAKYFSLFYLTWLSKCPCSYQINQVLSIFQQQVARAGSKSTQLNKYCVYPSDLIQMSYHDYYILQVFRIETMVNMHCSDVFFLFFSFFKFYKIRHIIKIDWTKKRLTTQTFRQLKANSFTVISICFLHI